MKKLLNVKSVSAIILCFILAFTLCACQNAEPSSSDDVTSTLSSPSSSIDDEASTDTTVDNSSQDEVSSETTDTPSKDTEPPATSSGTNTESSNTQSGTTDKTPTPSEPTTESTPTTTTPTPPAQKTAKELIVGKWRGSADIAPMFSEMLGLELDEALMMSCDVEFTSNGNFSEVIDRTSLKNAYTRILTETLNATLTENNLTKEEFEASIGQTFDEYVNSMVQMAMELIPQTITGTYNVEGNSLYSRTQDDADFEKAECRFNGENELIIIEDAGTITYTRIG